MLPRIPYKMRKNKSQVTSFRGINYSNMTREGDLADSKNISARAYPYLTTRRAREHVESYTNTTAMTMFMGKIVTVAEGVLYWGDKRAGRLMPGAKQFALVNTKLCIMPDKKYLYIQDDEPILKDMGASVELHNVQFTKNALKIGTGVATIASGFGCTVDGNVLSVAEYISRELKCDKIGVVGSSVYLCALEGTKMTLKLRYEDGYFILDFDQNLIAVNKGDIIFLSDGTIYKALENGKFRIRVARRSLRVWQEKYPSAIDYEPTLSEHKSVDVYVSKAVEHVKSGGQIKLLTDTFDKTLTVRGVSENEIVADVGVDDGLYGGTVTVVGWDGETAFADLKSFENKEVVIKSKSIGYKPATLVSVTDTEATFSEPIGINAELLENISLCVETDEELADIDGIFKVGDGVTILGSGKNSGFTFIIAEILREDGETSLVAKSDVFEEGIISDITVERRIPKLDFICESENRLWGCSNEDSTIYASALGDPTNFFVLGEGLSTDSYSVPVGSEGDFTACCRYGSDVLFWKESKLHKVIGSYPAEYAVYSFDIEGVQKGCEKSLAVINEVLYYKGIHGVYAFASSPSLISANFGERRFTGAIAGADGNSYYLSVTDGKENYLFVFETELGLWILEDNVRALDFVRDGENFYMLAEDGKFYRCGAEDTETGMEWFAQLTPFYETIDGAKTYSRLLLRVELPIDSYLCIDIRADGGVWHEAGKVIGRSCEVVPIRIPINRCDKFELRLRGKGKCTVLSMMREYFVSEM